jgi:hypothetical protein
MLHICFYTICLVFRYTSWRFYAFSGTNLLTRCHSASSPFSAIFVFQKSYTGNILGIGRNKIRTSKNLSKLPENQRGDRTKPEGGLTTRGRGPGTGHAALWRGPPWSTSDAAPSPINTPRREKPKHPITFPETYRDLPPSSTQDREGPEALPSTLPERGIATGGLLHRHACLRRDEWVVYLGLWVHSSS